MASSQNRFREFMSKHYRRCLEQPLVIIAMMLVLGAFALHYARNFTFDASADTLIAQGDPDLLYQQHVTRQFGDAPFLVMTYSPKQQPLLSASNLETLADIEAALKQIKGVRSVMSILDAPLLKSPPIPLDQMARGYKTLRQPDVDLSLAEQELTHSPIFHNQLISADAQTAAIRIDLVEDAELNQLGTIRDQLRAKTRLSESESAQLARITQTYDARNEVHKAERDQLISDVRAVKRRFAENATLHLGGVPMVAADMIDFVRRDMTVFGGGILGLMLIALWFFFRRIRWVLIPLLSTAMTILLMIGLLGYLNQPVTAISANFIALLAIITLSFTIHLIERYRELRLETPDARHIDLVYQSMRSKLAPSIYTGLTTGVAFASLLSSDIVPVADFGWIMCVGLLVSLLVTYSFFASLLVLMSKGPASSTLGAQPWMTRWLAYLSLNHSGLLTLAAAVSLLISLYGLSLVSLDNRFTEYFKKGTEIRDGMTFIDQHLGGTLPMDILLDLAPYQAQDAELADDPFANPSPAAGQADNFPEKYWFTPDKLRLLEKMDQYLQQRPEVGKVVSLHNLEQVARDFNQQAPLDAAQLVSVLNAVPESVRKQLIDPYASPKTGELRLATRIHETGPVFSRDALIADIKTFATAQLGLPADRVHVTGITVLFNNMLNSLFSSQTSTIGFVLLATLLMFILLLRSVWLGIIGLIPNLLAAVSILAFMGFAGIPLDLMTITIAAIVIGIGVDDAIHYLHRFKEERDAGASARDAVARSHGSIGNAMYFTSITIVVGFSLLSLSSFIPTVTFGLLTALAMIMALLANLTILPALLIKLYR